MKENYNINGRVTMYKYNDSKKYKLQKHSEVNVDEKKMFSAMDILEKSKYTDVSISELDFPIDLNALEEYIDLTIVWKEGKQRILLKD